jgi:hypothetical protein
VATRVEIFPVTIPANTAIAAPVTRNTTFNDGRVERIEMRWPPGPAGLVGLRIAYSGQVVIPFQATNWLITDDEAIGWDIQRFPETGRWQFVGYNTDQFDHTIQVRFLIVDDVSVSVPGGAQLVAV